MGNIDHSNAKTTIRIRKEIENSKETIAQLDLMFSLNPKTVLYGKYAGRVTDKKCGPTSSRARKSKSSVSFVSNALFSG